MFKRSGFTISLDADASFHDSNLVVTGWTNPKSADSQQGLVTFTYRGSNVILYWIPQGTNTPESLLASTFNLLRNNQPNLTFTAINEGNLKVAGNMGFFGGFVTTDSNGQDPAGGLIGTWPCTSGKRLFALTVTSTDATALQIRFDRLISGFGCHE